MIEEFDIPSEAYSLPARLHLPENPKAAYVLHGATGVPRDYYAKFVEWVADQGFAILTYGYRADEGGVAGSRITMADWGITDQNAALNALADRLPDLELRVIGHSLGGFMTMFHDRAADVRSISAVCSGPAYWKRAPWSKMASTLAFWFVLGPVLCRTLGYLPGRVLGGTEDVPAPAFAQWRRWCTNPELHRIEWGTILPTPDITAFAGRLNLVAASDDWMIPPPVVRDLADFYPAATTQFQTLEPDASPIGHLAVFRPRNTQHWPTLL